MRPESSLPTNVHVLIGRNGVGKTHAVNQMTNALVRPDEGNFGEFVWDKTDDFREALTFPNIISVTFSAFDPFESLPNKENKSKVDRHDSRQSSRIDHFRSDLLRDAQSPYHAGRYRPRSAYSC